MLSNIRSVNWTWWIVCRLCLQTLENILYKSNKASDKYKWEQLIYGTQNARCDNVNNVKVSCHSKIDV